MKYGLSLFIMLSVALIACSDSTTENVTQAQSRLAVVDNAFVLPDCNKYNQGEYVFSVQESRKYVCNEGVWQPLGNVVVKDVECSTEKVDGGIDVICNGVSIGVIDNVKNGSNGLAGDDGENGKSCSVEQSGNAVIVKCFEKTMTLDLEEFIVKVEPVLSSSSEKIEVVPVSSETILSSSSSVEIDESSSSDDDDSHPVSLDTLSGYSQKGPFVRGSVVRLYELQDGRTLKQTNGNFTGTITSDDGRFKINSRDLMSQYVMLQASGYYRNEITGKPTDAELTLKAITDVSDRNIANVNLLTHLEFERVHYLVTEKKMKVKAAKRQAQAEILDYFYIDTTGIGNSEDLTILGDSKGSAALLAISVILQGTMNGSRSVAELSEILASLSAYFKTGHCSGFSGCDFELSYEMEQMDLEEILPRIRRNIEGWNLGVVPDFESMVRNFWYKARGLDECSIENNGTVRMGSCSDEECLKGFDNYELFYILRDTRDEYGYSCVDGRWRRARTFECHLWKACDTYNKGEEIALGGYFECDGVNWVPSTKKFNKGILKDPRDGKEYKTIGYGIDVWMAENLNYEYKVLDPETGDSIALGNYCYDNDPDNCEKYGRLYEWAIAADSAGIFSEDAKGCGFGNECNESERVQGICPEGWNLPSETERRRLGPTPSNRLLAQGYDAWPDATDDYGFSVLPAGVYELPERTNISDPYDSSLRSFDGLGSKTGFWSADLVSSLSNTITVYQQASYFFGSNSAAASNVNVRNAYSVRCVKNRSF